ncbi:MAG: exonuclease SbcCD subunit D C-terminal domain-containing protein, partial [Pseudomonadota bacterium]
SVEHIRYAGSLMKYSFAEAEHTKSVNLVEIDGSGSLAIEQIPLVPRRDVRRVEGHMAELLKGEKSDDYIEAVVLDREPILDAMGKLRTIYPNVLHLERPCYTASGDLGAARADHRTMGEAELFSLFFKEVTGDDLTGEQLNAFSSKVEELRMNHREV